MERKKHTLIVGITGGIASGKTTVARELEKQGAVLIDADAIGHDVVDRVPEVRVSLRESFGESLFTEAGAVDRSRLAERVFSDPEALETLNRIVHPHLLARIRSQVETFRKDNSGGVLVIDAALLVEWRAESWVDMLVVVESDPERQIERIRSRDGLSREAAVRRIASQVDPGRRAVVANEILMNERERVDLIAKARDLWERLSGPPSGGPPSGGPPFCDGGDVEGGE